MDNPLKYTIYDRVMVAFTILGVLAAFFPLLFYNQVGEGDIIPIHYNLAGEIDGWGNRTFLWIIPLLVVVFYVGLIIVEKKYRKFNFPIKITENNATPVYRLGVQLIRHLKLLCIVAFAYLNNSSLAIAMGYNSHLNKYIMMSLVVLIIGVVIVYYVKILMYRE